jgi:hypothetical protein
VTRETRQSIARIEDLAGKRRAFADILIPAAARKLIASSDKNAAVGLLGAVAELISHTAIAASGPVVAVPGRTYR